MVGAEMLADVSSAAESLCGTAARVDWLQSALQQQFRTDAVVTRWDAEAVGKGQGYLSVILKVRLQWSKSFAGSNEAERVVVKLPTAQSLETLYGELDMDGKVEAVADGHIKASHNTECGFYELFKGEEPPIRIPRCYYTMRFDGPSIPALIMQDISIDGHSPKLADGLTLKQCQQVIDDLTALQAWSLQCDSWKDIPRNDIVIFEKYQPGFILGVVEKGCAELKQRWPSLFDPSIDQVTRRFKRIQDLAPMYEMNEQVRMPPVLCHGDFWTNNMFVKNGGVSIDGADLFCIYDWQFAHMGNAAEDLAMMMCISVDTDVRREHELELISYYYAALERRLGAPPPFSLATFMKAYRAIAQTVSLILMPFLYIVAKEESNVSGDDAHLQLERIVRRCKSTLDDFILAQGKSFLEHSS